MGYKYTCDERLFEPHKLTPERAYIVGVAWADGYLGKQGLRITSSDVDWLRALPDIGGFTAPVYARKNANAADLVINNKALIPVLSKYGFHNRKSITGAPSNIPSCLISHFMRGVFDGDGHVWSERAQLRVYIAGNEQSVEWCKSVIPSGNDFFVVSRSGDSGRISGRSITNNHYCRVLQSRNSVAAESFLKWVYRDSDGARLERKHDRFVSFTERKGAYYSMVCPVCSEPFERSSSTDVYCAVCARVRLRLCNRRAYHMRRNPETASNDVNDYRTKDELDLFFPSSLYGSRSKKNKQLMDALKDATCTAPTK